MKVQKGVLLIHQAQDVVSNSEGLLIDLDCFIKKQEKDSEASLNRIKSKIKTMKEERDSLNDLRKKVKRFGYLISRFLTDHKINVLIEKFGNDIKNCSIEMEDVALQKCLAKVIAEIEATLVPETAKADKEYKKWKDNLKFDYRLFLKESLPSYGGPSLQMEELPDKLGGYDENTDFYAYATNNLLWGFLISCAAAATAGVVVPTATVGAGK